MYRGTGLQMDDHARTLVRSSPHGLFDGDTWIANRQHDAVRLQVRSQGRARLRLFVTQERWSGFDDVHSGAETGKGLPKLDADGAAAEDRQGYWQLRRNRGVAAGPEIDGLEARDRWNCRGAAVGDHHGAPGDEVLASDPDGALVGQLSFTPKEPGPSGLDRGGRPAVIEVARHRSHPRGNLGE